MWTTRGEGKNVLPWGYVEYFLRIQIFVGERQQKKPICYFGLTLCCDPKLLLLLEGHKSIEGGFGDTTRINIPMAIVAIKLSEVDLEQKKQLPVTVQERISSAASDCVVLMGPLPRKLKKLSISYSIWHRRRRRSVEWSIFIFPTDYPCNLAPLHMHKGCPLRVPSITRRALFLEEAPVLVFRIFLPANRIWSI